MAILLDINTGTEKPFNPFKALREKQKAAQADITQQSSSVDIKEEQNVTSLITLGDEIVQNLLKEQTDPLSLQEKLKALFSADVKTDDPFPINARELHEFLGIATEYRKWFPRNVEHAGLIEDQDFRSKMSESTGGRPETYHMVTVDAAKELAMLQRSELGKLVRRYLIWAEKKLHEVVTAQQEQQSEPMTAGDMFMEMAKAFKEQEQRLMVVETEQEKQNQQLSLISNKVNSLEAANKIEKPAAVISKRCNTLNGLTTRLVQDNILSYQQSKQECYNHVLTEFGLDIDQELEKYKTACRRYYEHYKIYKGTPPKDVLRPAAIDNLGWISYVSTNLQVYNSVRIMLESYLNEE